jgi:hypothetical protein
LLSFPVNLFYASRFYKGDVLETQDLFAVFGALQGYIVGLGIGAAYGWSGWTVEETCAPAVVLAAMTGSDGWASGIVPHLAYGLAMLSHREGVRKYVLLAEARRWSGRWEECMLLQLEAAKR